MAFECIFVPNFNHPQPECTTVPLCKHTGDSAEAHQEVLNSAAAVIAGAAGAPGSAAGAAAATGQALMPTIATTNPGLLGTNVLHDIDHAAQVQRCQSASCNTARSCQFAGVCSLVPLPVLTAGHAFGQVLVA